MVFCIVGTAVELDVLAMKLAKDTHHPELFYGPCVREFAYEYCGGAQHVL